MSSLSGALDSSTRSRSRTTGTSPETESKGSKRGEDPPGARKVDANKTGDSKKKQRKHGNRRQKKGRSPSYHASPRNKHKAALKEVHIFTSDFASMKNQCGVVRYKVHMPRCSCPKIEAVSNTLQNGLSSASPNDSPEQLDGLVVIPESKMIRSAYLCLETGKEKFHKDPLAAEKKLREELFAPGESDSHSSFKVSCATCLLQQQPNGFICVSSPSRSTVDFTRDMAREKATEKRESSALHADHAHFICTIPRSILWRYFDKDLDKSKRALAKSELAHCLSRQGAGSVDSLAENGARIELGHHLRQLLLLTKKDVAADTAYWLVLVCDDTGRKKNICFTIDLPGGKRHLGETSFEGAVRETEEEISLTINEDWRAGGEPRRSRSNKQNFNNYYMMRPPGELLMESLTKTEFWNSPGFCKEPLLSTDDMPLKR